MLNNKISPKANTRCVDADGESFASIVPVEDGGGGTAREGLGHPATQRGSRLQHPAAPCGRALPWQPEAAARGTLQPELRRGGRPVRLHA